MSESQIRKMENDENGRKLPEDLVTQQILPWLPVKPLVQYKLVSKDWYDIISSPNFTLKYTKQLLIHHPSLPVQSLFVQSGDTFYLYSCENDDTVAANPQNNLVRLDVDFNINFSDPMDYIKLVGVSNGLVCLAQTEGKFFVLYNPATSQYHKFYPADYQFFGTRYNNWGFGYDSVNDDFKVVRILFWNGKIRTVHVYSLKLNVWRKVDFGVEGGIMLFGQGLLANDTLYWTMRVRTGNRIKVVAFDLTRETFEVYPHLTFAPCNKPRDGVMCVIGGCLAKCSSNDRNEVVFEIVKHPGEVVYVCRYECGLDFVDKLIGFTKTGKVFFTHSNHGILGLLDRDSKQTLVTFEGLEHVKSTYIDKYVPSQISPHPSAELPNAPAEGTWADWAAYQDRHVH